MRYKTGHKVKPHSVKTNGIVMFTDGTNEDLTVNQYTCEAYGYKYIDGVCCAFIPSAELMEANNNETVLNNGDNNDINHSKGILVNGSSNTSRSGFGCFVSGQKNEISVASNSVAHEPYINNSSIIGGSYGHVIQSGQIVIGGGGGDGRSLGQQQMVIYTLSGVTTTNSDVVLYIQNDADRADEITLPEHSISLFEVNITGLTTGGSSGTAGHYKSVHQVGTVAVSSNSEIGNIYDAGTTTTTASSGRTGAPSIVTDTAGRFRIKATGESNVVCTWFAVVKLYINKTTLATF